MRFTFTEEQETFRRDVREFLAQELTADVIAENRDPSEFGGYSWDFSVAFRKKLAAKGYLGISLPEEYGGGGKNITFQAILAEEIEYLRAPTLPRSVTYIAPSIIAYGTEDQKRFFIPRIAAGDIEFFVGYTESEAGSDLASLNTRAVQDGDEFVVTGSKAFCSDAHHVQYGWIGVRTNPDVPKHKGISLLIVDMNSPGITLGAFTTVSGWHHPTVYFEGVHVPESNLVGEVDKGWYYIMGAIDFERSSFSNPGLVLSDFDRIVHYCASTHRQGKPMIKDPAVRQRLAELYTEVEGARLMSYWLASQYARGMSPQHEAGLAVLVKRETVRLLDAWGVEMIGPLAQLRGDDPLAPAAGGFEHDYKENLYFSFAAGGFDITRNVIASRGLGLPRS